MGDDGLLIALLASPVDGEDCRIFLCFDESTSIADLLYPENYARFMTRPKIQILLVLLYLIAIALTVVLARDSAERTMRSEARLELGRLETKLTISLDKYRSIPIILSANEKLLQLFNKQDEAAIRGSNKLLEQYNDELGSDAIFVIARDGTTLAASNWDLPDSFVGVNYAFRPYFINALQGHSASYFALGTRSGKRGYYFSYPIKKASDVLGVIVLKVSLSVLEESTFNDDMQLLLTDNNGLVFYSTVKEWNYRSLAKLDEPVMAEIMRQQKFGNIEISPLILDRSLAAIDRGRQILLGREGSEQYYLKEMLAMPLENWSLVIVMPKNKIYDTVAYMLMFVTVAYLLLLFVWLYWRGRVHAQEAMGKLNDQLEARVETRTRELSEANVKLRESIGKYQQSEEALKQAQNELIQAAKLATLGEMSAGINHELNQPLAALRTYTENSKRLLDKHDTESVKDNLDEMLKLASMMSNIINQLKVFARKSSGKIVPIRLKDVIEASIAILQNKIKNHPVDIEVADVDVSLFVYAESIQLELVMINLLNNALEATASRTDPWVRLSFEQNAEMVQLLLEDNGPGLYDDQLKTLFEPFYTTKQQGLGLGLALSRRIVESFGGSIIAANREAGGARFTVVLRRG
ncbi:MAG: ATP-binding protein [Pseudomonadales bacterium]